MDLKEKYAIEWNASAEFFSCNGDYDWMETHLHKYHTVLEIGCGTGYSTLSLLNQGHKVICVEKNSDCIHLAKNLIEKKGYTSNDVVFLEGDIFDYDFLMSNVEKNSFDIICCWNPGTYWAKDTFANCGQLIRDLRFPIETIKENPVSSYVELLYLVCAYYAKQRGVPFHIIERGQKETDSTNDVYFYMIEREVGFIDIDYDNRKTKTLSKKGRPLTVGSKLLTGDYEDIVLISVLMK